MAFGSATIEHSFPRRWLPLLVLLFVGSGAAALIYEVVWLQLLQFVIGSTAVSLGVLLGSFMGGMCVGSLLLPAVVPARWHPLRVYAALEVGIGVYGLWLMTWLPHLDRWYTAVASVGLTGIVARALVAAACLLPPTVLMGATLPAVARYVQQTPTGTSWLGYCYGGNILGAVVGCLAAGFYLLRWYDMLLATRVAAAINFSVALIGWAIAIWTMPASVVETVGPRLASGARGRGRWLVFLVIGLSGFSALGAEVVWTRLLSLSLGGTVYTFSLILAVFLTGLGVGSSFGARAAQFWPARSSLGWCQFAAALAILWAAVQTTVSIPYWPIDPGLTRSPWDVLQLDVLRCAWAVLPGALCWGASFPFALAAVLPSGQAEHQPTGETVDGSLPSDNRRLVGAVYAANTLGAIIGALLFSLGIIGWWGTQRANQLLAVTSLAASVVMLAVPVTRPQKQLTKPWYRVAGVAVSTCAGWVALYGVAVWLTMRLPATPGELIAYGRFLPRDYPWGTVLYAAEGQNASVAVTQVDGDVRNFHVSGKVEASSEPMDMRLQRMLGHLPALLHPHPRSVLVVGCGAGVTAGSFVVHPSVERLVICEIEPLVPQVVARYFAPENYGVIHDARVQIVYDDARHFILTCQEKFDVITSDPIHPWIKGAASLYTEEYFQLCKKRLNPGGLMTQWVPLYETDLDTVRSELATFFHVFPRGSIWSNDYHGSGYDIILLGQEQPLMVDVENLEEKLLASEYEQAVASLQEVGFSSVFDLLATFAGTAEDLQPWLAGASINRDINLRIQYLAGMSSSLHREASIFDELLKYCRERDDIFVLPEERHRELWRRIRRSSKQEAQWEGRQRMLR